MLLSVLIPSIPERMDLLEGLVDCLEGQSDPRMEVLVLMDNRRRFLGEKRNALMQMAKGKYLCHIDDDEMLSPDFFKKLLPAMEGDFDLIAYNATCSLNGSEPFLVRTKLGAENEQPKHLPGGRYSDIIRQPWFWCLWRSELARQFKFPEYFDAAEDWTWLRQILPSVKTHVKVEESLFHHRYNAKRSAFPTS